MIQMQTLKVQKMIEMKKIIAFIITSFFSLVKSKLKL